MVLESTMICVDDSDYMRNGDFVPTRLAAMQDAVNIVCHTKTRTNPENNVGLITLASSEVLTTLTTDASKLMSKLLALQPGGELKLMAGLRVAHLALKHRQGKNHKMRIVVFIGSPIVAVDEDEMVKLAKRLKKEKVNLDIITFGEEKRNQELLSTFVDTLNGKEGTGSHLVVVPPGPTLTDALLASPVLQSEDGVPLAQGGGFDFGIDPNDDPELALALRVSMEEQRARQDVDPSVPAAGAGNEVTSEEQMLENVLATMGTAGGFGGAAEDKEPDFAAMTEDEQIAYAMQMSMSDTSVQAKEEGAGPNLQAVAEEPMDVDGTPKEEDGAFLAAVLDQLPEDGSKPKDDKTKKK